jgi:hypothetical protein
MRSFSGTAQLHKIALILGFGAVALGAREAPAATAEFDSFHAALVAQDKQAALAFIGAYPASRLVDDLIEMLPRAVAQAVCGDLPSDSGTAQDACRKTHLRVVVRDLWGEPILTNDSDLAAAAPPPSGEDTSDSGVGDSTIAPAAGSAAPALASARARPDGTTGERGASTAALILPPPRLEDSAPAPEDDGPAANRPTREKKPTPDRGPISVSGVGGDPGSDAGGDSSPTSHGKDPGSDSGSDAGGDGGHESHN